MFNYNLAITKVEQRVLSEFLNLNLEVQQVSSVKVILGLISLNGYWDSIIRKGLKYFYRQRQSLTMISICLLIN